MKNEEPGKKSPAKPKRNPAKEGDSKLKSSSKAAPGFTKKNTTAKAAPRREEKPEGEKRRTGKDAAALPKKTSAKAAPRREEKPEGEKKRTGKDAAALPKKTSAKAAPRQEEKPEGEKKRTGKDAAALPKKTSAKAAPRREEKPAGEKKRTGKDAAGFSKKTFTGKGGPRREVKPSGPKKPFWAPFAKPAPVRKEEDEEPAFRKPRPKPSFVPKNPPAPAAVAAPPAEPMRLNKYIAHCGVCARRQAAEYVKQRLITVNDEIETNPGYLVVPGDQVKFKGEPISIEERKVYILMNKPKNVITTSNDEKGRKTVLDIIGEKIPERIFPVGRLDRMTSGLLLLTNDGDLAKKLSHPKHKVQKFYLVTLDKPVTKADMERIQNGLELEDGLALVNGINYVEGRRDEVGIELHIGKNRIIRRIFEHLGYVVTKLDRTYFAGLTKKDIGRGRFRHLTEKEVIMLKHFK